ncbi:MAG: rubredoxin [Cyanobacteriota bacterium]|jgi:rubredoxin
MTDRPSEKTLAELASPNHECRACGYVYIPSKGDERSKIPPGTPFEALPLNWRCPVCSAPQNLFISTGETDAPSGFAENLDYGFGFNRMSGGKKNLLIFGSLFVIFLFFISLYGMS